MKSIEKTLPSIPAKDVVELLGGNPEDLEYWAWPHVFGSTTGPFGGIGGQTLTTFTVEAWHDGTGKAVLFSNGRVFKVTDKFIPPQMRL